MPVKAAVVGVGKFGKYHVAKYSALSSVRLVGVVDICPKARQQVSDQYSCQSFAQISDLFGLVDIVSITTPATTHAAIAIPLLQHGINLYIEKPIATNLNDAERIIAAARENKVNVQIGHQERFILSRLRLDANEIPRVIECCRLNTWSEQAGDVDVALDLLIHDVDLVLQLAPGHVKIHAASGSGTPFNHDIFTTFTIGAACLVQLHATRKAEVAKRTMKLEYSNGNIFVDFLSGRVEDTRPIAIHTKSGDDKEGIDKGEYDPLGLAIAAFVESSRTGARPLITAEDGRRALNLSLDILNHLRIRQKNEPSPPEEHLRQTIPLFDIKRQADRYREDVERRIARILDHKQFIDGPEVRELETQLASLAGVNYCLSVSSGTMALTIALMAEGLTKSDAVFVPAFTYNATCNAVLLAGATPIFVDVELETGNMSKETLAQSINRVIKDGTLRPALVIAVDLYGAPCTGITSLTTTYGIPVLCDAAQSFGASHNGMPVGSLGEMTATSFFPSKTLGGFGDGGALFTNDKQRFEKWKSIRWHGTDSDLRESVQTGLNGRLSSIHCAIILAKIVCFMEEIASRRLVLKWYHEYLPSSVFCLVGQDAVAGHACGLFTIALESATIRARVMESLKAHGISTGIYYSKPLHRHIAFQRYLLCGQRMPNSDWLAERVLSLPMSPYMTSSAVREVCVALQQSISEAQLLGSQTSEM